MKQFLVIVALCTVFASTCPAQQNPADAPATKEDIDRYFQVAHLRENMRTLMGVMSKQVRQTMHDEFAKKAAALPPDFQARMDKMIEDVYSNMPIDDMLDVMIPVYQKHLTKSDVDALVAFTASPVGQKMLNEMPAMTAEAMQAAMPIVMKKVDAVMERVQQEVAQMEKDAKAGPKQESKPTSN